MKNAIRNISILLILILHVVLFAQTETPQLLEPTQIKADIDTLVSKLKDVHPTFLNHYKSNNLQSRIDSIKKKITKPMSSLDFFRIMQPIVSIDGHTTLINNGPLCPNEDSPLFPFKVIIFNNSLYIKENLSANKTLVKGSVIEKINGVSSEDIIRNLIRYIPGEKETYKTKRLEKDFHIYMALVYGSFSDFNITVDKSELKLKGGKWADFQEPSKPKFELRFYDDDIAYIYKRMYMPPKDFIHFMDSAFTVISEKQIDYLIIDNLSGSGLSDLADSLMSYFTAEPYSMLEKKMTKISPLTKEFIDDKKSEGFIKDGYFIEEYPKHSSDRKNRFSGSTYILTGPLSYSTGTCFSAAAKCYHNAFIVGQESGQPLLSNGDGNQFELPETKMFCITALSKVYMPGHNNDEVTGVLPDYKVTPTLEDLLEDKEYTLKYTLKLIRENKVDKENVIDNKEYYFNQPLPGDSAVIFAPGIVSVSGRYEYGVSFSPDLEEIYFTAHTEDESSSVYFSKLIDKKWTNPKKANLTKGLKGEEMEAFVNHSGNKIYFTAYDSRDVKIWQASRSGNWWTDPIQLDSPINDDIVFYSNAAKNGDLFYKNVSKGKMYFAPNRDGKFPEIFEAGIEYGSHGFIAPLQDFMLIDALKDNDKTKDKDIHVCFKKDEGTWTKPINLGSTVNSNFNETCPSITPDGKFLFFSRYSEEGGLPNIYWVSTGIIEKLKDKAMQEVKHTEELFEALNAGNLAQVKNLINSNPNLLEVKDQSGSTPLIRACLNFQTMGRQVEVAKFLIEAGANVNVVNNYQATALLRASVGRGPDYELIKLLVENGADVNIQGYNGITALHWAVKYNDLKTAKLLLESGANINISNEYNGPIRTSTISGTVLQVAINYSQSNEMVKFIIENGAKLNINDSQGNTELHLVALKGNTEQAKILIEHGIDINAENNFNRTALYYAARHGYRGVAELLIASGADKSTIVETNYGKAKQLSESLEEGEAYIWDLNFSYAVKTKNNLLVFTLGGIVGESSESGLANGFLNADELKDQKITMFLRHRDYWKMDGKAFTELAKLTTDVNLVSSFKPDFSKTKESEISAYHLAQPNESFTLDGLKVHPIPALAGGIGYLVEVDGLKIFHAGLHISDDKPEHIEKYCKEIDFLKSFAPIDIVMLSTHNHSNRLVGNNYEQYLYLIDQLKPKAIYLWGANVPEQYITCADFLKVRNIPIVYPELNQAGGERFYYISDQTQKK